jgi:1,2-diacylglycerol 3-beta-galactosyltransferase
MLKKGWTLGTPQTVRVLQFLLRLLHPRTVELLNDFWQSSRADLVVSVVPHFNRALAESLRQSRPATRFVTLLTDIADYPPHFWIEPQGQYIICGSDRAVEQAHALEICDGRIFKTSGMILHPRFYQTVPCDRRAERRRRGLDPDLPTGLVLFGGQGSEAMLEIAERLDADGPTMFSSSSSAVATTGWRQRCAPVAAACGPLWRALPGKFPSTCFFPISSSASPAREA